MQQTPVEVSPGDLSQAEFSALPLPTTGVATRPTAKFNARALFHLGARPGEPLSLTWAYRLFWLTFITFFCSTGAGKLWDRVWHLTHRFDTFWTPPHFFVFIMTMTTGLLVTAITFIPQLRIWYGPTVRMPFFRFPVPGPLVILGGGLVALSITIMFDNFWHTAFGLDETQWSIPHDMLGWSWFIVIMGFTSARLAFRKYRPLSWITKIVVALLVLEFLCPAVIGPFYLNYSPNLVNTLRTVRIVLSEPSAQHMYNTYLHYGLTRQTSPLFIPLVTLFAGMALTLLRGLDQRKRIFLLAPLLWSLTLLGRDLYTLLFLHYHGITHVMDILPVALKEPSLWIPIPIFVAALSFELLRHTSLTEKRIFGLSGMLFALCSYGIWHTTPWMLLLIIPAAFTMILGAWIGKYIYSLLEKPTFEGLMKFMLTCCAEIPAILGVVDLIMRRTTP